MTRPRHKQRRGHDPRRRYERLARQLIIHGKRLAGTDEDFVGGIHRPISMSEADMAVSYEWARQTPNRWYVRATVYCRGDNGTDYREVVEAETGQPCLVNELSTWRLDLLKQASQGVNHNHIVAEGFEMGVI